MILFDQTIDHFRCYHTTQNLFEKVM